MPALRLFVSHSSRLDDVPRRYTDDDANWCLLRATCDGLQARYGDAIRILVDRDGLIPGDDWNLELNLWLAECQAAVILVSRRALERSDWVAKEAAILGWRRALDPNFKLILVTIEGESSPDDLAQGFFGALDLGRLHCVHAGRDAAVIVDGIARGLGDPDTLAADCARTPLDLLQGGIARLLAQTATEDSLEAAAAALGCADLDPRLSNRERCAAALARRLLRTSLDGPGSCFQTCRCTFDHLAPRLTWERARELLEQVRPLWVHPAAAAYLPAALDDRRALTLSGQLLTQADDLLGTEAYTLERYLQRAWPGAHPRCVPVGAARTAAQVQAEIRRRVLGEGLPPMLTATQLDRQVNREPTAIVVIVCAADDGGGLPDPRLCAELEQLTAIYDKLVLVFASTTPLAALPETLRLIMPPLDPQTEGDAFLAERAATIDLYHRYGRHP